MSEPEVETGPAQIEDENGTNPELLIGDAVEDPFPETWPTEANSTETPEVSD